MTKTSVTIYNLKIALITQNKQNIFCFRFKKQGGGGRDLQLLQNRKERVEVASLKEKKLKEKARNHMRELKIKRKKRCKIEKKENEVSKIRM